MSHHPGNCHRRWALAGLGALLLAGLDRAASAGILDGTWCAGDGRRITVAGSEVITPGGRHATGAYSQSAFRFALPNGEPPAGAILWMEPKGPNAARVSVVRPDQQGPPEHDLWRRCDGMS